MTTTVVARPPPSLLATKRGVQLPPLQAARSSAAHPVAFNTFESSPTFRTILHGVPESNRSPYRPARANCDPVSISRSVSPHRPTGRPTGSHPTIITKGVGRPWDRAAEPTNDGRAPVPVRVDNPPLMDVSSIKKSSSGNDKVDPHMMLDFQTRARACKRAGRDQAEGVAMFNIGLLHEATGALPEAISAFKRYLEICTSRNDALGKAVSNNCIAAMYQKQGNLGTALKFHHAHVQCADIQGKFVGHTNLGCVYASLGEYQVALEHHQHALRYAIRMESQTSQAIAINNLGIAGGLGGDLYTAKACMERFLELSNETHNRAAAGIAYAHLADIALMNADLPQARILYGKARQVARYTGNLKAFKHASIQLGIVIGQMEFDAHMQGICDRVTGKK